MAEWAEERGVLVVWGRCERQRFHGVHRIRFVKNLASIWQCVFLGVGPSDQPPGYEGRVLRFGDLTVENADGVSGTEMRECQIYEGGGPS